MREVRAAVLSLIVADLYPMDLQTSTDFPTSQRFWQRCGKAYAEECPVFRFLAIWFMLPEWSKDDDDFQGTA